MEATDDPSEVGVVDVVVVGVKAWQVPETGPALSPMIGPETMVLPLQNGVEAPRQLVEALGTGPVIAGLCGLISFVVSPGHICHAGADPFINFGELDNRPSDRVERLRQVFARTKGVTVEVPPDIHAALWRKFLFIVGWSGVGAVTRAPIGTFRSVPETRQMLLQVMQEVADVAQAHGIVLPQDIASQTLSFMDSLPPDGTASMQRDIIDGRPSELEAQNGAVARLGQEVGVDTPLNTFIYHALLPLELRARGQLEFAI